MDERDFRVEIRAILLLREALEPCLSLLIFSLARVTETAWSAFPGFF